MTGPSGVASRCSARPRSLTIRIRLAASVTALAALAALAGQTCVLEGVGGVQSNLPQPSLPVHLSSSSNQSVGNRMGRSPPLVWPELPPT